MKQTRQEEIEKHIAYAEMHKLQRERYEGIYN